MALARRLRLPALIAAALAIAASSAHAAEPTKTPMTFDVVVGPTVVQCLDHAGDARLGPAARPHLPTDPTHRGGLGPAGTGGADAGIRIGMFRDEGPESQNVEMADLEGPDRILG